MLIYDIRIREDVRRAGSVQVWGTQMEQIEKENVVSTVAISTRYLSRNSMTHSTETDGRDLLAASELER